MWKDEEILEYAQKSFREFMEAMQTWREREVNENYSVIDNHQWKQEDYDKQLADGFPVYTINHVSPIVDSISGFEIQNRGQVNFVPRTTSDDSAGFASTVENGVNYIERDANVSFYNSQAFRDMLICGVGATNSTITYDHNQNGDVKVWRVFPGFLLWDAAAREKNLRDANWCAEARITYRDRLPTDKELKNESLGSPLFIFNDAEFLNYYNVLLTKAELTVVFDFQWRTKEPVYRVRNPFFAYTEPSEQNTLIMNFAAAAEEKYKFKLEDSNFILNAKSYREFRKSCEMLGIELKSIKQEKYRYYRCEIRNGLVDNAEENISQSGFSMKFMTGKYSEIDQCFYGAVRAAKDPQRLFNKSVSDIQGFINVSAKGGYIMEYDAVDNLKAFIKTVNKGRDVTVVNKGALTSRKIQQKNTSPIPAGLPEMLEISKKGIMDAMGVNPQWMGLMESKEMTGRLHSQIVRQGLTILAPYFDAKKFYAIDQGRYFIDCLRVLAENEPGRLIRNITGDSEGKYTPLLIERIAPEYDIEIEEVPETPGERQENFEKLLELAALFSQKDKDILPLVVEYAPLKKDDLDAVRQLMAPPPPPQPDPLQQKLLESTIELNVANAAKSKADAINKNLEALNKQNESARKLEKLDADIEKTYSETELNQAKTVDTLNPMI